MMADSTLTTQQQLDMLTTQLAQLRSENQALVTHMNQLTETQNALINIIQNLPTVTSNLSKKLDESYSRLECYINNLPYELMAPNAHSNLYYPRVENVDTTIDLILSERKSLVRFGDGEFSLMKNIDRPKYQQTNPILAERLAEVLTVELPDLLIGIADNYGCLSDYTHTDAQGIREYLTLGERYFQLSILSPEKTYYDARISRPYIMYNDKNTDRPANHFLRLKEIWNNRDVILIEGSQTRAGVGNDLFSNTRSLKRIIGPATNAFDRYDELLYAALDCATDDTLFLVALGPCAKPLVFDLVKSGHQAIDFGHIDIEYEWFLRHATQRIPILNKYTNEALGGDTDISELDDAEYNSEIVKKCL